ncbi:MAG TPA: hypothetical protein DCL49_13115 [Candidatus Omnitrophica bacterium]|nr:hypothetical protein [Candidatus Omnitrophota bacterium]
MTAKLKRKKRFLIVSPMFDFGPFLPLNISVISAILEKAGYEIKLFDATFYKMPVRDGWKEASFAIGIFKPVNWMGYGMDKLKKDYIGDFKRLVRSFEPDFIGISIFTTLNEKLALSFIDAIDDDYEGQVIVGGIHCDINLERVKHYKKISAIIAGECENMLEDALDFLAADSNRADLCNVPNLIYRDDAGTWKGPSNMVLSDIEHIPFLNWDYFDERNFYRPFEGKVLRMGHVEMARGCPFRCTYCINERFNKQFSGFWRVKSVARMLKEIRYLNCKYKLEAIKFWDDDFLAMDMEKLKAVTAGVRKMGLKFLCHSRPEHMSLEKVKVLADNGCIQVGVGVESGNPEYRRNVLNRRMTDERIIEAFRNCRKYNIISSAYCMIGMPDETRKDILATARLLREANPHVIVHAIYAPYEGNRLYQYAKSRGYLNGAINYENTAECYLEMPSIPRQEVEKLFRTFIFYSRLEDSYYPLIAQAEQDENIFRRLKVALEDKLSK